jgi:two-component system LytT family sensor kinase
MTILHEMKRSLKECLLFLSKYRIHLIAWFFFIFYEIIITGVLRGYFASPGNYLIFYFFNISLFYLHAHVVLPTAHKNTNYTIWLLPTLILIEVVVYVPLTIIVVAFFQKYANLTVFTPAVLDKASLGNGLWRIMYFILFSSGYYYLMNYLKERKITQQAEKERLLMIIENQNIQAELIKSQYAHLKSQINPHFLFNTLSFIYSNTRKIVPEAAEAIMALSEMMRYALQDDSDTTFTLLTQEIEQVENLIRLHQIKSENKLNITLKLDDKLDDVQIIPLILVTLVENIFKHGDLLREENPARVSICSDGNTLIIETENFINTKVISTGHHIGLDNTRKRLNMIYGNKASLAVSQSNDNYFNVLLRIELN